jgi:U3 small nucleolar RNA-associated protein 24
MGTAKKTRKFGAVSSLSVLQIPQNWPLLQVKRLIGQNDARLKKNIAKGEIESKKAEKGSEIVREVPQVSSALFFQYNTALVPPYSM